MLCKIQPLYNILAPNFSPGEACTTRVSSLLRLLFINFHTEAASQTRFFPPSSSQTRCIHPYSLINRWRKQKQTNKTLPTSFITFEPRRHTRSIHSLLLAVRLSLRSLLPRPHSPPSSSATSPAATGVKVVIGPDRPLCVCICFAYAKTIRANHSCVLSRGVSFRRWPFEERCFKQSGLLSLMWRRCLNQLLGEGLLAKPTSVVHQLCTSSTTHRLCKLICWLQGSCCYVIHSSEGPVGLCLSGCVQRQFCQHLLTGPTEKLLT